MLNNKDFNFHQYVWCYFQLHAEQRLKTFEFYIVMATVLLSGYGVSLKETDLKPISVVLGILLTILSFVFWKLDIRNKQLIKNAEQALKTIENECLPENSGDTPNIFKLLNYDDFKTKQEKEKTSRFFWQKHFSYSKCFNTMFFVFAILGIIASLWACRCLFGHKVKSTNLDNKPPCVLKDNNFTGNNLIISGRNERK